MVFSTYQDAGSFLAAAGEMLYQRETVNHLMLGIAERLIRDPDAYQNPFFATVRDAAGEVRLAAVMTPPHNLVLARKEDCEDCLGDLIDGLLACELEVPGLIGPLPAAEAFVHLWEGKTRQTAQVTMHQRVYELRHVRLPPIPSGHFRIAGLMDAQVIAEWVRAFSIEALNEDPGFNLERAQQFINLGSVFVWEDEGELVAMAMKARPIAHSVTVNAVYTPPEYRRQGYATALVARLSQHLLDLGYYFINLSTDLDFPTSNAIYQKIGYHPVCDFQMVKFVR